MNNEKRTIKFPAGKMEEELPEKQLFSALGLAYFYDVKFNDEVDYMNYKESMELYVSCLKDDKDDIYEKRLIEAIKLSKYNVEARIFEIDMRNITEYEKEQEFLKLCEESSKFKEGCILVGDSKVNIFHFRVCDSLADFYLYNKLYARVISAYDETFRSMPIRKEVFRSMYYKKLIAAIIMNDFNFVEEVLTIPNVAELKDDVLELIKVFYNLMGEKNEEAVRIYKNLLHRNPYVARYLNRIENPDAEVVPFNNLAEAKESSRIVECFRRLEILFAKEYFFDFFMEEKVGGAKLGEDLNRCAERMRISIEDMRKNPIFNDLDITDVEILHKERYVDKSSFYDVRKEDLTKIGVSYPSIKQLEKNGIEFDKD